MLLRTVSRWVGKTSAIQDEIFPLERAFDLKRAQPLVVMIAGVNGAGKTTSIGKLAHTFQRQGASVLLAAGDTFRAAAREQLIEWGSRNNVTVISQDGGDPAAVAAGSQGERPNPVYWIGVGESLEDLQPFVADEFAGALLAD